MGAYTGAVLTDFASAKANIQELSNAIEAVSASELTFDTIAAMESATGYADGRLCNTLGFYAAGDSGGDQFLYNATGRTGVTLGVMNKTAGGTDDYWERVCKEKITTKQAGCRHNDVANDQPLAQAACDEMPIGATIVISPGRTRYQGASLAPRQSQTIVCEGTIVFDDGGVSYTSGVIQLNQPGITLMHPRVDSDQASNVDNGVSGTQSTITNYGAGTDCTIIGGELYNNMDNGFQGGRDGLRIRGLKIRDTNEHAVYLSGDGNQENIVISDLKVENVALKNIHSEGHCIQVRRINQLIFENCQLDVGTAPTIPSFYFNLEDVSDVQILGGIGKGSNSSAITIGENLATTADVLIDGFHGERVSGAGSITCVRVQDNSARVKVIDCTWDGYSSTEGQPETFDNCTFNNVTTEMNILQDCQFLNCTMYYSGATRMIRAGATAKVDVVGCTLHGNTTTGIWIENSISSGISCTISGNTFPDKTTSNAVLVQGGQDHFVIGNRVPLSTSGGAINFGSTVGGVSVVRDNYLPASANGGIQISASTIVSSHDRRSFAAAAPTGGYWSRGSVVYNQNATANTVGWVCTLSGNPGTWEAFPGLSGGGGVTNLSIGTRTASTVVVESDTGADATFPAVTTALAGAMISTDKVKMDHITVSQAVDLDAMEGDILAHQTVFGIPDNQFHMGAYTGTILTSDQTLKSNIQELSYYIEGLSLGEANTGVNVGAEKAVFKQMNGTSLEFRTLYCDDATIEVVQELDKVRLRGLGGGSASRKDGQVVKTANNGSLVLDFDNETKDNVVQEFNGTGNSITIASLTRGGRYTYKISSSVDGTARTLTWALDGGGMAWGPTAQSNLPSYVSSEDGIELEMHYDADSGQLDVKPFEAPEVVVDGTTLAGTWQPDFGFGVGKSQKINGTIPAGVTLDIPLNMPIGATMRISSPAAQSNGLTISANSFIVKATGLPTWGDGGILILIHRDSEKYYFSMSSAQ